MATIRKLKGETLAEVLVSFTIISICVGLVMFLFSDVPASFKLNHRNYANIAIENIFQEIEKKGIVPNETGDSGIVKIIIEWIPYNNRENLLLVTARAEQNNKVFSERKRIFITDNEEK